MKRKYLAFDIETAKNVADESVDLKIHRPLGITCTAVVPADTKEAMLFYSKDVNGKPAPQMTQSDLSEFVDFLSTRVENGYTIVTLNGLGFDFDILAEESGRLSDCRRLAFAHVDIMFHVHCERGFPVGLSAAARALGLSKTADVDGSIAPKLWKAGEHNRVLEYVTQDCNLTLAVATMSEDERIFRWVTKSGKVASHRIPRGWLRVGDAIKLPLPDTSWMDRSWPREQFTAWLA